MASLPATALMRMLVALATATIACGAARAQSELVPREKLEPVWHEVDCDVPVEEAIKDSSVDDLGGGLKLVQFTCWRWAYNFGSVLFVADPAKPEAAQPVRLRVWQFGKGFAATHGIPLPRYDRKRKLLTIAHKYRGPGDCGHLGEYRWTGSAFEMRRYWNKDKCDGKLFGFGAGIARWQIFPKKPRG